MKTDKSHKARQSLSCAASDESWLSVWFLYRILCWFGAFSWDAQHLNRSSFMSPYTNGLSFIHCMSMLFGMLVVSNPKNRCLSNIHITVRKHKCNIFSVCPFGKKQLTSVRALLFSKMMPSRRRKCGETVQSISEQPEGGTFLNMLVKDYWLLYDLHSQREARWRALWLFPLSPAVSSRASLIEVCAWLPKDHTVRLE